MRNIFCVLLFILLTSCGILGLYRYEIEFESSMSFDECASYFHKKLLVKDPYCTMRSYPIASNPATDCYIFLINNEIWKNSESPFSVSLFLNKIQDSHFKISMWQPDYMKYNWDSTCDSQFYPTKLYNETLGILYSKPDCFTINIKNHFYKKRSRGLIQ